MHEEPPRTTPPKIQTMATAALRLGQRVVGCQRTTVPQPQTTIPKACQNAPATQSHLTDMLLHIHACKNPTRKIDCITSKPSRHTVPVRMVLQLFGHLGGMGAAPSSNVLHYVILAPDATSSQATTAPVCWHEHQVLSAPDSNTQQAPIQQPGALPKQGQHKMHSSQQQATQSTQHWGQSLHKFRVKKGTPPSAPASETG